MIVDGLGGHPFVLQRRGAGGLGCASVAHGDSLCGISLQFDDALSVAALCKGLRNVRGYRSDRMSFACRPFCVVENASIA